MNTETIKKIFTVLLFGVLSLLAQGGFKLVTDLIPAPNLFLIIVVYLGFFEVSFVGAVLGFLLGIIIDLSGGVLVGPAAGGAILTFGVLAAMSGRVFVESSVAVGVVVFLASILNGIVLILITSQFAPGIFGFGWRLFGEALISALFAPLVFKLLRRALRGGKERSSGGRISVRSRNRMSL